MRKTEVALAAVAMLTLSLAGCSTAETSATSVNPGSCADAFSDPTPVLDQVEVDPAFLGAQDIWTPTPLQIPKSEVKMLTKGSGTTVTNVNQSVDVSYFGATSIGGAAEFGDNSTMTTLAQAFPSLSQQLLCATEGSRVSVAVSPKDMAPDLAAQFGLSGNEGLVLVLDLTQVVLSNATGKDVFNADMGMPAIIRDTTGRPGVVIPAGDAPTTVRTQQLIDGEGDTIAETDSVAMNVLIVDWNTKAITLNTWDTATPVQPQVASLPPAFRDAINGKTVGSSVQLVIPANTFTEEEAAYMGIDPSATVVMVVDLLAKKAVV